MVSVPARRKFGRRAEGLASAQIFGDRTGMLKILFHPDTRKVLSAHVIGESVVEIVHIGRAVRTFGGTMDSFREAGFNYPTFAEGYKVAGLDGLNKLKRFGSKWRWLQCHLNIRAAFDAQVGGLLVWVLMPRRQNAQLAGCGLSE